MKRFWKIAGIVTSVLIGFIFINNSSLFVEREEKDPILLAHRGMAQTFPMEGLENDTCTAKRIYEPEHPYIENTIPSMEAAFKAGADLVELDIQPTSDGQFAVFHDWTLDCRTDGTGITREHSMEELKQLDIGYGYTADDGETFPFRGEGTGLMPTLEEVLTHFPEADFLIHIKSDDPEEGYQLAEYFSNLPEERMKSLAVYGGAQPIQVLKAEFPELRAMSMDTLKSCMIRYLAVGWTGHVPQACENSQIHIPEKYASWMWGWPEKFQNRMADADARLILVAGDGKWSEGFDHEKDLERIPDQYSGGLWTNRIDRVAPLVK